MKKEKTKLRVIQILCIVSLLVTVFSIQKTYAKYFEKVDTTYATNIKKWTIEVNDKYIHEETTLSNVMNPTFFYNENMDNNGGSNNILVPGREGCFDFLIDYSNVDVGFKFAFDIEQLNKKTVIDETTGNETEVDSHLEDLEVYGYIIVDSDFEITSTTKITDIGEITTLEKDAEGKYLLSGITQEIDITTESSKQKRILVLFRWYDGEDNIMDNKLDTEYTGNVIEGDSLHTNLNYKVKITFTQTV